MALSHQTLGPSVRPSALKEKTLAAARRDPTNVVKIASESSPVNLYGKRTGVHLFTA